MKRSRDMDAPAAQVWSLLASPQAWSLKTASFAFDIAPPGPGRLRVAILLRRARPACLLYEVRDDVPGQVMSLSTLPAGRERLTITAEPCGRGTRATIVATSQAAGRAVQAQARAYWQVRIDAWLANADAVLHERLPWPGTDMDPGLNAACRPSAPLRPVAEVSASVLINAPAGRVWDAVYAPQTQVLADPEHFMYSGQVPGTPTGQRGEMQYFITRQAQGGLSATAIIVTELAGQRRAVTAAVAPSRVETEHEVTPTAHGTDLALTFRWSRRAGRGAVKCQMADELLANLNRFKTVIENPGRGQIQLEPGPA